MLEEKVSSKTVCRAGREPCECETGGEDAREEGG